MKINNVSNIDKGRFPMNEDAARPNVWVVYYDQMKNLDTAKQYGRLREMFTGFIDYRNAVDLAIKMFRGQYKQGDYILEIGQPKLVGIVMTVAEKYFSEDGTLNILYWSKREQRYYPEVYHFPDDEEVEIAANEL